MVKLTEYIYFCILSFSLAFYHKHLTNLEFFITSLLTYKRTKKDELWRILTGGSVLQMECAN